jgi:cell division protein ZipA
VTELRWVLVLLGLAVVAGVYLWGRKRSSQPAQQAHSGRVEPKLEEPPAWQGAGSDDAFVLQPRSPGDEDPDLGDIEHQDGNFETEPSRILLVHVRAAKGSSFQGAELFAALKNEGLRLGDHGAFESLSDTGEPLFTVANMVEPGTFPKEAGDNFATQGITVFMVLPGPGGVESLAAMIASARSIARTLGGDVLDETGSTLTNQGATHLREQAIEFQRMSQIGLSAE